MRCEEAKCEGMRCEEVKRSPGGVTPLVGAPGVGWVTFGGSRGGPTAWGSLSEQRGKRDRQKVPFLDKISWNEIEEIPQSFITEKAIFADSTGGSPISRRVRMISSE